MLPARRTPAIPLFQSARAPFSVATIAWKLRPPRDSITVIVKATCDLVPGGAARLRDADLLSGDVYGDDRERNLVRASDFAIFKKRADVTLVGCARSKKPATAMRVTFRFGLNGRGFDRSIAVIGERRWIKATFGRRPGTPAPFTEMPLVYERAFGGPSVDSNPVGVGRIDGDRDDELPNLEDASALLSAPSQVLAPVCFAPIPPSWKQRACGGTYDARWLSTRWPYWPEDVDYSHEQSAPLAQQLAYPKGDDPFLIAGMHAEHAVLEGTLPGVRPRCIAQRARGGSLFEIALALDTVAFEVEAMKIDLVWRAVLEVDDDEATELDGILIDADEIGATPSSPEAIVAAFAASKEIASEPPPARAAPPNEPEPPLDQDTAAKIEEIERTLASLAQPPASEAAEPALGLEAILDSLKRAGMSEADVDALREAMAERPAPEGDDRRARFDARIAAGEALDGMDLEGLDLSGLDLSGRSFVRTRLKRARLVHTSFAGCDLEGANFEEALAPAAIFDGANLHDADLHAADLRQASFRGARLDAAILASARAEAADFSQARGVYTDFADAHLERAHFDGADLASAEMSRAFLDAASFVRARLCGARLFDAHAPGARFDGADLADLCADGVSMPGASLREVEASGSIWEAADLTETNFFGAKLSDASFARARGERAVWAAAELGEASFRRANLEDAVFLKANLMKATFERAILRRADLRGANLHGAELFEAVLDDVRTDLAIVTASKLEASR